MSLNSNVSLRSILVIVLSMLIAGCATVPPVTTAANFCGFKTRLVSTQTPEPIQEDAHNLLAQAEPPSMLLLSGGGEDGAFGAGVLNRWHIEHGKRLPKFRLVTGISTGAVLATFAFIDRPDIPASDYQISAESQLAKPFATKNASGGFGLGSYLSIAKHNAIADLSPLEKMLTRDLTPEILAQVAKAREHGRRLEVGAVDVDSGDEVAFDLVDMAENTVRHPERMSFYRQCYIRAIIASSSQPPFAPPIFIDNREYIDGGARFSEFSNDFAMAAGVPTPPKKSLPEEPGTTAEALSSIGLAQHVRPLPIPPVIFIIVNGNQTIAPQCGKLPAKDGTPMCQPDGTDPYTDVDGAHVPWTLISLAMRSSQILINQIDLFSINDIYTRYNLTYGNSNNSDIAKSNLKYMFIEQSDLIGFHYSFMNGMTCPELEKRDNETLRPPPLEFHPSYMHCLVAYGEDYAARHADTLNHALSPSPPFPTVPWPSSSQGTH